MQTAITDCHQHVVFVQIVTMWFPGPLSLHNIFVMQSKTHAPVNLSAEEYDHKEICGHKDFDSFVKHKQEQARRLTKAKQFSR